jgi:hypothetical protein
MRIWAIAALAVLGIAISTQGAAAQVIKTQPFSPSSVVVPAADTTGSLLGGGIRNLGRVVAGTLENNAIIRTLNNLLGRTVTTPTQPGYSPLPSPTSFQSTGYQSAFKPVAPVMGQYGKSPTPIFPK